MATKEVSYAHLRFNATDTGLKPEKVGEYFGKMHAYTTVNKEGYPHRYGDIYPTGYLLKSREGAGIVYQFDARTERFLLDCSLNFGLGYAQFSISAFGEARAIKKAWSMWRVHLPNKLHRDKQKRGVIHQKGKVTLPSGLALPDYLSVTQFEQVLKLPLKLPEFDTEQPDVKLLECLGL
jgi:hypothetical protein